MQLHLNETIRALRKARGLTQEQLAEAMGVSIGAVSKWEGGLSNPDLSLLPELADFFECSVDVLLGYEVRSHSLDDTVARICHLITEKQYSEGILEAQKALTKYPNVFRVVYQSARLFDRSAMETQNQDHMRQAGALYEKAAILIDQNTDETVSFETIQNCIGSLYAFLGDPEQAIAHLKKNNVCGVNDLDIAMLLHSMGRYDEALPLLSKCMLNTSTDFFNGGFTLATCLANLKQIDEAIAVSDFLRDMMLRLIPDGAPSIGHYWVAILDAMAAGLLLCQGDRAAAETRLRKAVTRARDFNQHPSFRASSLRFFHGKEPDSMASSVGVDAEAAIQKILKGMDQPERDEMLAMLKEAEAAQ